MIGSRIARAQEARLALAFATGLAAGALVTPIPAGAMTFDVDRTDDTAAATACTVAPNDCSLRGAIIAANTSPTDDDIDLPAGTYVLTVIGANEDSAATGDLDVVTGSGDLQIDGEAAATTIIDGNGTDRVLDVHPQLSRDVLIGQLTIQNGASPFSGGGIRSNSDMMLTAVVVRNNSTEEFGGGIYSLSSMNINESNVTENVALYGGGLFISGGPLAIGTTAITGNTASQGGGLNLDGSGQIEASTIANNSALYGGGIVVRSVTGTLALRDLTISANTARVHGGGILVAALLGSGSVIVNNVTVTQNVADSDDDGLGDGGGVVTLHSSGVPPPTVEVSNSIGSGNIDMGGEAPDCSTTAGGVDAPLLARGYNLIGSLADCTLDPSSDLTGSIVGPPDLGPLASNGGDTQTHRPNPTSLALNAGNPAAPGSGPYPCEMVDQRGNPRPEGAACDIGAVEVKAIPVCGDDSADGTEVCDGGTCCAPDCLSIPVGAVCDDDGIECTFELCDATATCTHPPRPAGLQCGDQTCTQLLCDGAGACIEVDEPRDDCFEPLVSGKAALQLSDKATDTSDKFTWKWITGDEAGPGAFGDPRDPGDASYMCVYDAGGIVFEAEVESGGTCVGMPCWSGKEDSQGFESFKFNDKTKSGLPDGILKVDYKNKNGPGKSKLVVKGKGLHLDFTPPPWTGPVTAQFIAPSGGCWSATYSTPTKNELGQFKAKAD